MGKPFKLLALLTGFFLILIMVNNVYAQTNSINASSIQVDIWPEYDRPAVLVAYHVQLTPETKLPAQINLRIPAAGSPPFRIIYFLDNNDRPYEISSRTYDEGNWSRVVFTTPSANFKLEYYDATLDFNTAKRSYIFEWAGDIPANELTLVVQKPATATGLLLPPRFSNAELNENDSLYYYTSNLGQIDVGSTFAIAVRYTKEDSRPSLARQSVFPNEIINRETTGRFSIYNYVPATISIALVLITFGLLVFWGLRQLNSSVATSAIETDSSVNISASQLDSPAQNAVYCAVCGNRAATGDNFCRVCGSRITS